MDNASSDGTPELVRSLFPEVCVIEKRRNLGFATGCNVGILSGRADLVLLLNPDCEISASALQQLVDCLEQSENAACAVPVLERGAKPIQPVYRAVVTLREFLAKMLFLDRALGRHSAPQEGFDRQKVNCVAEGRVSGREVDYVVGACVLCRRLHLESVGLLDSGFFLYFEDQDLSLRLRERGFRLLFCPEARIEHVQGVSADQELERAVFESYRSLCYFFDLHKRKQSGVALRLVMFVGASIRLVLFGVAFFLGKGAEARSRIAAYRRVMRETVFRRWRNNDG